MSRNEIIEQVNGLLSEEFEIEQSEFTPDSSLKETLQLDSINLVDLIALVQMTYQITIPVEELHKIQTFNDLYNYTFAPTQEPQRILFNVLPDLKAVCIFPINKDLYGVINDRFNDVQFIHAMTPVWRYQHQRSFTGHYNKLYATFLAGQLHLFAFQQNRFKFCNAFDASHEHDALYFIVHAWKQLRMDALHDELHLSGDLPDEEQLIKELKQYLQKVYVSNPAVEFNQAPATKIKGMPYDLMTLVVKGR